MGSWLGSSHVETITVINNNLSFASELVRYTVKEFQELQKFEMTCLLNYANMMSNTRATIFISGRS